MATHGHKALVTGGAGFIGSHLVDRLIAEGWEVVVLDDLSSGSEANLSHHSGSRLQLVKGSITEPADCERALSGVTHVFHLAARPSVVRSIEYPFETNEANVTGTLGLLELCRKSGRIQRFVMTSSSSVYGNTPTLPKVETMAGNPLSPYALQKWTGESYVRLYHSLYGLPGLSLRPFNVFGPRQRADSPYSAVIPRFLTAARSGEPLIIHGDGSQTRDFTYVANAAECFYRAGITENPAAPGKAFNLGNSERTSVLDLASRILKLTASGSRIEHRPPRPGDVRDSYASIELARELLGYSPRITFAQGLELLIRGEANS